MGLHPGTPGSWPEPKADAQPLSHPGAPNYCVLTDLVSRANTRVSITTNAAF